MPFGWILVGICVGLYFLLKFFFGNWKADIHDPKNGRLGGACFIILLLLFLGIPEFGNKTPGSFWERADYKGHYIVLLYPGRQATNSQEAVGLIECETESGTDQGDEPYTDKRYKIDYAIMSNGSRISFNPDSYESLEVNKVVRLTDDDGNNWGVKLTPQSVSDN
ncbi:hypothetical protein EBX31_04230 [bacterium]|nr:hypothetical protein [bacterium]